MNLSSLMMCALSSALLSSTPARRHQGSASACASFWGQRRSPNRASISSQPAHLSWSIRPCTFCGGLYLPFCPRWAEFAADRRSDNDHDLVALGDRLYGRLDIAVSRSLDSPAPG